MSDGKNNNKENLTHLKAIGAGDGALEDIAQTALILASFDRPGLSFQKYEHHLKILTLDIAAAVIDTDTADNRAKALRELLHDQHDYTGNEEFYEDLQNANLMSVIDTRRGLPVSLSIIYMHVARSVGWHIEGINFPGHFLIRLYGPKPASDGQVIIDPFNGGKVLSVRDLRAMIEKIPEAGPELNPAYYEAVTDRDILVRLLNNIKIRCLKVSDLGQAINILTRLVLIDPHDMQHHYELGMLQAHVKQINPARKSLLFCLENIDKFEQNDLIEQQVINTLQDLEKQDVEMKKSNVLPLPETE